MLIEFRKITISDSLDSSAYNGPVLSAWSKSEMRSFTSSIPTEMRTRSSVRPLASRTVAGILAWDIKLGMLIRDLTLPTKIISQIVRKANFIQT